MRYAFAFCAMLLAAFSGIQADAAKPFTENEVPGALKPWVPWVMQGIEHNDCPFVYNNQSENICSWPTQLSLDIGAKSGAFTYAFTVYDTPDKKPQRILLPGGREIWPQDVKIDKHAATVLAYGELPSLLLTEGTYTVTGSFNWDSMPPSITLPPWMGLVHLKVSGADVAIPDIENNQLLIQRNAAEGQATKEENRLDAKIFRKVTDDIPLFMETAVNLEVSGKQREEELGKVLPEGFIPVSVDSELPARLESDGTLRMQLRPGIWRVNIGARYPQSATTLKLPARNGILSKQEIWSFEPRGQLRLTRVEGVDAIDPSQADVPQEWRQFPAYLMKPESTFTLTEKKRGVSENTPDQLSLSREIWLDFDGSGYTFKDTIGGAIHKATRLEASEGVELGDATINGKNQFITRVGQDSTPGVEVREGPITLSAGSRIESGLPHFSATGWKSSFDQVSAQLYLPPGWSLFTYSGVDTVSGSWVSSWSLLDLFLVLLAVVATFKLYDLRAGGLALVTLVLLQHELDGFTQLVLLVLVSVALLRYLPRGKFRTVVDWGQQIVLLLLVCTVVPFMIGHIRHAIYPQLFPAWAQHYKQQNYATNYGTSNALGGMEAGYRQDQDRSEERYVPSRKERVVSSEPRREGEVMMSPGALPTPPSELTAPGEMPMAANMALPPPPPPPMLPALPGATPTDNIDGMVAGKVMRAHRAIARTKSLVSSFASSSAEENYQQYAPDTKVQTGYGNASWRDNSVSLSWSGVVDPSVTLKLWLLSAHENLALAFLRVLLMVAFLGVLLGGHVSYLKTCFSARGAAAVLLIIGLSLMTGGPVLAAERSDEISAFPPKELLDDMRNRLAQTINEAPSCAPLCASVERTHFSVDGNTLMIFEDVHVSGNVALPLPGGAANWRPSAVMVDDAPATGVTLTNTGYLFVNIGNGVHHVKMLGSLPSSRDAIGISLPVPPHYTSAEGNGWEVQGIHENGQADNSVQLIRTAKHTAQEQKTLERTDIKPFFQLERTFILAQQWRVRTVVTRITPAETPAAAHIPLLPGETITTADIQVKDSEVYANFDPGAAQVAWESVIAPSSALKLTAAKDKPWVEIWRLTVSNLWHAAVTGIPRVNLTGAEAAGMNNVGNTVNFWQWQPWPGESVNVDITRPKGVEGDTRTLDASTLNIVPGERSMELTLSLKIRSSLGGQHEVTLPEGAILRDVTQNGMILAIEPKQNVLSLPLVPGANDYTIRWKQNDALPVVFKTPEIKHGLSRSVNAETSVTLPGDRWLLFAHGPQMGPAVLFWSWVPVMLILSFVLGKITLTPLRMQHWLLLLFGLSQTTFFVNLIIIAWLMLLGWRSRNAEALAQNTLKFNFVQILLGFLTVVSLNLLFASISMGLLGAPDMHVMGGGSSSTYLHWYQDITRDTLPVPVVVSVSIWAYRVLMLLWSLWLAFALVGWLRWGWKSFTEGGYWKKFLHVRRAASPSSGGDTAA